MSPQPTYEELEQRIKDLEIEAVKRKCAEELLKVSEERYRHLSEGTFEAVVWHEDGKIIEANEQYYNMFGYRPEELAGKDAIVLTATPDSVKFMREQISLGHLGPYEVIGKKKNGTEFPMEIRAKKMQYKGKIARMAAIRDLTELKQTEEALHKAHEELEMRVKWRTDELLKANQQLMQEIKDRKQAEEKLRESEEKYKILAENSLTGVFVHQDRRFVFVNDRFADIHGYTPEELLGKEYWALIHPDERDDAAQRVSKRLKKETVIQRYEVKRLKKDGTPVWCEMMATGIDYRGRPAIMGNIIDITDRKQAEKSLKSEREQLLSIFNNINQAIYINDVKTHEILYANETLTKIYQKNLVGGLCYKEFQGLDSPCDFCTNEIILKEKYKPYQWEYHNPVLKRDYIITDMIIKWPDGRDVRFEFAMDITDRKQAEEALKLSNEELLKESQQRRILSKRLIDLLEKDRHEIAMELHDHIGQILTSLKINLEMIGSQLKPLKTGLASQIEAAEKKAIQALKDIKSISRGLKPSILDTLGLESSLREFSNEIQKCTDIQVNFFSRNVPQIFGREKELAVYRVAQEALTNILKHARATKIHMNLVKKDEMLSLSVEDDGVGFVKDEDAKISKGKGPLGLFIMRERITQLGGEMNIESHPGKGTLVLAEIPI